MNGTQLKLFTEERREQIIALLHQRQRITVCELCQYFSVSQVTIRKDLAWIERNGKILRTHGGALWVNK
jgi:DeoR/GlpR family transcriptional regulator of sugar metabolism